MIDADQFRTEREREESVDIRNAAWPPGSLDDPEYQAAQQALTRSWLRRVLAVCEYIEVKKAEGK